MISLAANETDSCNDSLMLKSVSLMLSYKTSYPARTLQNPVSLTVLAIISRTQRLSTGLNSIRNSSVCTFQTLPFQSFLPIDKFISLTHVSFNNNHNLSIFFPFQLFFSFLPTELQYSYFSSFQIVVSLFTGTSLSFLIFQRL